MKKIDATDPEARSADLVADNIARLKALFPELVTEGKHGASVNVDVLKALVGDATVTDAEEKYGLNWHGKRRARQLALTPSTGTLRPCPQDSVDWDTTQNLMIEGDNLEVLKLLQKSYAGKVKLIYIDPPYNRDADVIYPDDFVEPLRNYHILTGQAASDGRSLTSATEASGRYHTEWMNMIFPRLRLASYLLKPDGVIFVSIDDAEIAHLRIVMDEVFGRENFIAEMVWEGANKNDASQIGISHEYVVVYSKDKKCVARDWGLSKEGVEPVLREVSRLKKLHGEDYQSASKDLAGWFRANKAKPAFSNRRFRNVDERGAYKEDDPTAPGGRRFDLLNPLTGELIPLRKNRGWSFDQDEFNRLVREERVTFVSDTSIMVRRYLHETDKATPPSVFYQPARSASERLSKLMGADVFSFPKDELVLQKFIQMATGDERGAIVMDFFAGSGSTAHAVMRQNQADGMGRRHIMVQLPEQLDTSDPDQKRAADFCDSLHKPRNIAELTKERLRRVRGLFGSEPNSRLNDNGFRVYKLDSSNIRAWQPTGDMAADLLSNVDHLVEGRTEADLLTELLLKLGLDLCVPIEQRTIVGKTVHSIGGGVLMACLDPRIAEADAEPLAQGIAQWLAVLTPAGERTCVFRDSAFANDVAKTNLAAILDQHGVHHVRSL